MSVYDVAQVCPNGHVSNSLFIDFPEFNKDFCDKCGEKTINECPNCQEPIRGDLHEEMPSLKFDPPAYCCFCGNAFPLTEQGIQLAIELATQSGELSEDDADEFEQSVNDVVRNTPRAQIGASRIKNPLFITQV